MASIGQIVNYVYSSNDPVAPSLVGQSRQAAIVQVSTDIATDVVVQVDGIDANNHWSQWTVYASNGGPGQQGTWY